MMSKTICVTVSQIKIVLTIVCVKKSGSTLITIGFVIQAKNDPKWLLLNNGATASEHMGDLSKFSISIRAGNLNARKD